MRQMAANVINLYGDTAALPQPLSTWKLSHGRKQDICPTYYDMIPSAHVHTHTHKRRYEHTDTHELKARWDGYSQKN